MEFPVPVNALRKCKTLRLHWLIALFVLTTPPVALSETMVLGVTRGGNLVPMSMGTFNARVGDTLTLSTEYGDSYDFTINGSRRSSLGNRVVKGETATGARLLIVVTEEGYLQGSLRDGDQHYRLSMLGGKVFRRYLDPVLARPIDGGAMVKKRPLNQMASGQSAAARMPIKMKAEKNIAGQEVLYPQYGTGTATLDLLFYYEAGMDQPEAKVEEAVAVTNLAMADSEIDLQVNVVGVLPLEVDSSLLQEEVLEQMFDATDAFADIESDRRFYGADLVVTLRENIPAEDDACGIAYVGVYDGEPWRKLYMAVVQWLPIEAPGSTYCPDTTTAHEIGHVLGSQHERRIAEPGDEGAYSYSFGHYGVRFHTIMSYGDEPEKAVFSNPNLIACQGLPCGLPEGDPESADNARAFTQTRFMLAGYQGESFAYELVRDLAIDEECQLDEGGEGLRRGHGISNDTALSVDIRAFSVLTRSGEVLVDEFDAGDRTLDSGYVLGPTCKPLTDNNPYGEEYVESWVTYANPLTGALIESVHLRWDNDYAGQYARVNISSSAQGTVEGHTTYLVTPEESRSFTFLPASGYVLADVKSSCGGELEGASFRIENVRSECLVEPIFEASGMTDPEEPLLKVVLEEPGDGEVLSGTGNLRGFAVGAQGIDRVEIWMNDEYKFDAPYGGTRDDVATNEDYEGIEGANFSGYSLAWSYSLFEVGTNKIEAVAYDKEGNSRTATSVFEVVKFHKNRIRDPEAIILDQGGSCLIEGNEITIIDALIENKPFDVTLKWKTASQNFSIHDIR